MRTEFLRESRIALRRVMKKKGAALTLKERADLADVLKQLDEAFDRPSREI